MLNGEFIKEKLNHLINDTIPFVIWLWIRKNPHIICLFDSCSLFFHSPFATQSTMILSMFDWEKNWLKSTPQFIFFFFRWSKLFRRICCCCWIDLLFDLITFSTADTSMRWSLLFFCCSQNFSKTILPHKTVQHKNVEWISLQHVRTANDVGLCEESFSNRAIVIA